jgi:hypothetical protein
MLISSGMSPVQQVLTVHPLLASLLLVRSVQTAYPVLISVGHPNDARKIV